MFNLHAFWASRRTGCIDDISLKRVFAGGEQLGPHLVSRFYDLLPGTELTNSYGPTEATVEAAYFDLPQGKEFHKPNCSPPAKTLFKQVFLIGCFLEFIYSKKA